MKAFVKIAALWAALVPALADADDNDLVLSRFGEVVLDGMGNPTDVRPDNESFRSLVSELGVVLAPKFLTPSDTLGYSGFQFSTELAFTTINNNAGYWCATEETSSCTGNSKPTGVLPTLGFFAKKGMWLPMPSFEIGAGALHLLNSQMWAGQAYAKFALHEGFHDWPIPSLAARGAVSRLFGSAELDLTVASFDLSLSKDFGVSGTVTLSPYAGWNVLWIVPRSQVIDKTPETDAFVDSTDLRMNFVFPDQDNIVRQRFFGGAKLKHYVFALTFEINVALAGSSIDDRSGGDANDSKDQAGAQQTYAVSLSVDF